MPSCQFCHTLRFLPQRSIADRLLKPVPLAFYPLSIGNIPPDRMILHYRREHPLLIETYDEMAASADRDLLMPLGAQWGTGLPIRSAGWVAACPCHPADHAQAHATLLSCPASNAHDTLLIMPMPPCNALKGAAALSSWPLRIVIPNNMLPEWEQTQGSTDTCITNSWAAKKSCCMTSTAENVLQVSVWMLGCLNAGLSLAETHHDYRASVRTLMPQFITAPDNNEAMKQAGLGVKLGPRHAIVPQPLLPPPLFLFNYSLSSWLASVNSFHQPLFFPLKLSFHQLSSDFSHLLLSAVLVFSQLLLFTFNILSNTFTTVTFYFSLCFHTLYFSISFSLS